MMESTFLRAKFNIPIPRPEHVYRPRLTKMLDSGLYGKKGFARKMTLISAPAGYGKTNLLAEWLSRGNEYEAAWVTLEKKDSDPARFWGSVIKALQMGKGSLGKSFLAYLYASSPSPGADTSFENLLEDLLNEIAEIDFNLMMVLDDYHLITNNKIHGQLSYFLANLPCQVHLVISSRIDPPLKLSLMRGRGELVEIRQSHLCLNSQEISEFLRKITGKDLNDFEINELKRRTEGWAAGLQMAAVSLNNHLDTSQFIKEFTGTNRFILEYLVEEILKNQTGEVQDFLLQTSILERFNDSLCSAVTGQENCQDILDRLEKNNLFLIPLDNQRTWYRYHQLFADLLEHQLVYHYREKVSGLHLRASQWFEENHYFEAAMDHALLAGDQERSAYLLDSCIDVLWSEGQKSIILNWLENIPEKLLFIHPKLIFFKANLLLYSGHLPETTFLLEKGEEALQQREQEGTAAGDPNAKNMFKGMAEVVRATIAWYQGSPGTVISACSRAKELFPREEHFWHGTLSALTGDALAYRGDYDGAYQELSRGLRIGKMSQNTEIFLKLGGKLAAALWYQGKLREAESLCLEQIRFIEEEGLSHVSRSGFLYLVQGEILRERNHLEDARSYIDKGEELGEQERFYPLLTWAFTFRMMLLFSQGELEKAEEVLGKMEVLIRDTSMIFYAERQVLPWKVKLYLSQGKESRIELEEAAQRLKDDAEDLYGYFREDGILTYARVKKALGDYWGAADLLKRFYKAAVKNGRKGYQLEALILLSLIAWEQGEKEPAINDMEQALQLGEPEGFYRAFLDEGSAVIPLLREAFSRGILPEYTGELVEISSGVMEKQQEIEKPENGILIEPLSQREIEILNLISQGLSNKEISGELFLALSTIKWYTSNIYSKLGVNRRTEAVDKARSMGIIS